MEPKKYRKKPMVVEAMQFTGATAEMMDVYRWVEENTEGSFDINDPEAEVLASGVSIRALNGKMVIATLEGPMDVSIGDYVIRGVNGEFYPCKPDIFEKTYDLEEE